MHGAHEADERAEGKLDTVERRSKILELLQGREEPMSASSIAKKFSVSRQIIVGDIAILRAADHTITATPRGYILEKETSGGRVYTIACRHTEENLVEELYTVVDNGGGLLDVIVEHPLYGQISGSLQIFSRYDVDLFLKKLRENRANPLSTLTGGIHLHTLSCPSPEVFARVRKALSEKGILLE